MTYIDAFILGLLQGLTEFLPVSSSGHLVLAQAVLGVKQPGVAFELLVHLGTVLAILIYFRLRIWLLIRAVFDRSMVAERKMIGYLILGTIPAGLAGFTLDEYFERAFSAPALTSVMLLVTGGLLLGTRFVRKGMRQVNSGHALAMGVGQAFAIMPGISRSGSTIAAGIFSGVDAALAAEFSFLLAIPAIVGAVVLKLDQLLALNPALAGQYAAGTAVSFLSGLGAVYLLLAIIRKGKLDYFAYYCFAAGAIGLYIFL